MSAKGRFFALLFGVFFAVGAQAATVSFLIMETGLPFNGEANVHSGLWESGLLDVFFEAGHIVSNAPVMRIDGKPTVDFPEEAEAELADARAGGVEFFIIALLDYDYSANAKPKIVSLRVFNANTRKKLFEQQYADNISKTAKEEIDNVKRIARIIVPHLNNR